MSYLVYVLKCNSLKYYVGRVAGSIPELEKRFQQHLNGTGSEWTKRYKPIEIIKQNPSVDKWDEDNEVYKQMEIHGVDNVRGGTYCQIKLQDWQIKSISSKLTSVNDRCYKCDKSGHFALRCPGFRISNYRRLF